MKDIFSKRLHNARKQAGLSQDQLVALINGVVKKTSIAKYERGEMMPDMKVVQVLATALGLDPEYFFRPIKSSIDDIQFVYPTNLGARKESAYKEIMVAHIERYLELEQLHNKSIAFENPFRNRLIKNIEDSETAAEELRIAWDMGMYPPSGVLYLLESNGIIIIEVESDNKLECHAAIANKNIPALLINSELPATQKRMVALIEVAKILFNFESNISDGELDRLCKHFAMAILMPAEVFYESLGRYRRSFLMKELKSASQYFGAPIRDIAFRAYRLEIITRYTLLNVYESMAHRKTTAPEKTNYGNECASRFQLLLYSALSEDMITMTKAADLMQMNLNTFINQYNNYE